MEISKKEKPLIIIASNRGPFSFTQNKDKTFTANRGEGGLVTALWSLAEKHDVVWVASAMDKGDRKWVQSVEGQVENIDGIALKLIDHNKKQYDDYYNVIANPLLWFIQHQLWDTPRSPSINLDTWDAWKSGYTTINQSFAKAIAEIIQNSHRPAMILPQDYHLYLVPKYLRQLLGWDVQIQPFIHIPWPGPDAWRILPGSIRNEILTGLLASNRIGFQTRKDAFNFVQTCRFYLPQTSSRGTRDTIYIQERAVKAVNYPISVDTKKLSQLTESTQNQLEKNQLMNIIGDRKLILRVDRIEPSKNILRGLAAYRTLLEEHPEHRGKVQMLALLVPSRIEVFEYQNYLQEIMAAGGMINAEFSDQLWEPVRIVVGHNYQRAIAAMQLYDVLVVNPIADGMNLVAKEGALVNQRDGVLVLSEHAGAFYELGEYALNVSPFDTYSTAEMIHHALGMPSDERQHRAEALRELVQKNDIKMWFNAQVEDALNESTTMDKKAATPSTPSAE
ncbi:trehalose-6-phosphate synthase [bacterium]|nr:trehalose-6-phosphate synthase [bacterium]